MLPIRIVNQSLNFHLMIGKVTISKNDGSITMDSNSAKVTDKQTDECTTIDMDRQAWRQTEKLTFIWCVGK